MEQPEYINMNSILHEVRLERQSQDLKWGTQTHPSVDLILQEQGRTGQRMCEEYELPSEDRAKQMCDIHSERGDLTWAHIAVEEMSEVVAAKDDSQRREELVQLAAIVVAWIESIDRNTKDENNS